MNNNLIRRPTLLKGAATIPAFAVLTRRGEAAQFHWKMATGQ